MTKLLRLLICALLLTPCLALAQGATLNAYQTVDIDADSRAVWNVIKDFDGLSKWHPVFSDSELTSGENEVPGATRRLTVKDGPSFDEELLVFQPDGMTLRYRIIGDNELPVADYDSTIQVVSTGRNRAAVLWRGSFSAKPGNKDDEVIKFIEGVYRAGLDNIQSMVE